MGNFLEKAKKIVKKIGEIIMDVIHWVTNKIRGEIEDKTLKKLKDNEEEIKKAKDPEGVGKIVATDTAIKELENMKNKLGKNLPKSDINILIDKFNIQINIY